jgi:hypothetical protein
MLLISKETPKQLTARTAKQRSQLTELKACGRSTTFWGQLDIVKSAHLLNLETHTRTIDKGDAASNSLVAVSPDQLEVYPAI